MRSCLIHLQERDTAGLTLHEWRPYHADIEILPIHGECGGLVVATNGFAHAIRDDTLENVRKERPAL